MRTTNAQPGETPRGFPYPDLSAAPKQVEEKFQSLPAKINLFRMLAHSHGLYVPLMDFTQAIFKDLSLPKRIYELVVLFTGHQTRADYEWKQHLNTAPKAGVSPEQIAAIEQNRIGDATVFDEAERLALRMASELIARTEVSQPTLHQATEALGPEQVMDVMIVVGFYVALAGIIRSVDLDYNPDAAAELARHA